MAKDSKQTEVSVQLKIEKKLRKRERTLRKRLQDARESQAEALERFKRAEARLEKRSLRTQNLEARLMIVSQQLGISQTPQVSIDQFAQTLLIPNDEDMQTAEPQPEMMQTLITEEWIVPPTFPPAEAAMMEWLANPLPAEVELELSGIFAIEQDASAATSEASEADEPVSEDAGAHDENLPSVTGIVSPDEANGLAKIARAVAETAEHAARLAIKRAVEVEARLEQMGSGRHLIQELEQMQSEADRASAIARQTQRAAEEAEHLAAESAMQASAMPDTEIPLFASEETIQEEVAEELVLATLEEMVLEESEATGRHEEAIQEEVAEELVLATLQEMALEEIVLEEMIREEVALEEPEVIANVENIALETAPIDEDLQEINLPLPEQVEEIEEIEEEEAMVEAITAKLIADAAAAAAAEAEALAEASSARTREARRLAVEADRALDNVYAAFLDGSLPEDEAQIRLLQAEHEATRAHAMLADAEAAEEEAINAARNAEAEAAVAESMAFASNDIAEHHFDANVVPVLTDENELSNNSDQPDHRDNADNGDNTHNTNTVGDVDTVINADNADATLKMPKIYPRQPM